MKKLFGERLREERKKQSLSAQMIAKACGVSRSYITLIENGKRVPSKKILPIIASALKLKTVTVLNWYLEDMRERLTKYSRIPLKKIIALKVL